MRLLNVRVPEVLAALIDEAVDCSDAMSKSEWVREALQAGAFLELAQYQALQDRILAPGSLANPPLTRSVTLGVQRRPNGRVLASGCQHPPTARYIGVETENCLMCGVVTKRRL